MPPSRLIIDINRCFEPSPFNTGPPIPSPLQENLSNTAANAPSTHPQSYGTYVPDLTSSPASSSGSSLQSLSLEDEEIKRIFAPRTEGSRYEVFHSPNSFYTPIHEEAVNYFTSKEYLNPYAAPFIPSSNRSTLLAGVDPAFQPSPLNLGFEPINFAPLIPPTTQNQYPFPPQSPHPNCIPLPPGSGRHFGPEEQEHSAISRTAPQSSPIYLPLLTEAFQPETPGRVRKVLAHAIVTSSSQWDLEALYDLGRRITEEARKPGPDRQENGFPVFPCDSARYRLSECDAQTEDIQEDSSFKREIAIADMSLHLYNHFLESRNPLHGQEFWWNLRESILFKFIEIWDSENSTNPRAAINFQNRPTVDAVRSALALCRSIGALFSVNLIEPKHISMCISILFKQLMSVEHVEALANLILASGPTFWKPTSEDTVTEVEVRADTGDSPVPDGSLSDSATPPVKRVFENSHVNDFLDGLVGNVVVRGLRGQESVVNMGWAQGRLKARLMEIHDTVKNWERMMMNSLTQPLVPPGLSLNN